MAFAPGGLATDACPLGGEKPGPQNVEVAGIGGMSEEATDWMGLPGAGAGAFCFDVGELFVDLVDGGGTGRELPGKFRVVLIGGGEEENAIAKAVEESGEGNLGR